jgi:hypothetical protein
MLIAVSWGRELGGLVMASTQQKEKTKGLSVKDVDLKQLACFFHKPSTPITLLLPTSSTASPYFYLCLCRRHSRPWHGA